MGDGQVRAGKGGKQAGKRGLICRPDSSSLDLVDIVDLSSFFDGLPLSR